MIATLSPGAGGLLDSAQRALGVFIDRAKQEPDQRLVVFHGVLGGASSCCAARRSNHVSAWSQSAFEVFLK